jgi:hypothetical protein
LISLHPSKHLQQFLLLAKFHDSERLEAFPLSHCETFHALQSPVEHVTPASQQLNISTVGGLGVG